MADDADQDEDPLLARTPSEMAQALVERRLSGVRVTEHGLIDRGGMGLIERVTDTHLGRTMARKVLAPKLAHDPKSVQYFLREAWITARLAHPAVVPVHELSCDAQGRLNFTMKLVDGDHLGAQLEALGEGTLSEEQVFEFLTVILRVCEALELAHANGIVHRDLKPDNVMVGAFGAVYLMDWGIAAEAPEGAGLPVELRVDDSGSAVGTPAYMAPEQAMGASPDKRTDVYGVGGLIYYVLTRKAVHRGRSVMEVLQHAAYETPERPSTLCPEQNIPRALEKIVLKALATDPEERHPTIGELARELRHFMRGGGDFPRTRIAKGQHVVREGEAGDSAFIIVSGRLRVYRRVGGERMELRVMTRGEVFGEMAILGSGQRTASVIALEPCELLVVTKATLQREVSDMKPWVGALVRTLARRFEQRERELLVGGSDTLAGRPPLESRRVVQLVLMLACNWVQARRRGEQVELRLSSVAAQVEALGGVQVERLVEILGEHTNFHVDVDADHITIRDPEGLRNALRHAL